MSDPTPPVATATLQRAGALCCVLAGALRIPSAFIDGDDPGPALEALYYVIDISLLFGLITLFTVDPSSRRRPGVAGFVLAAPGTGFLIGPEPRTPPSTTTRSGPRLSPSAWRCSPWRGTGARCGPAGPDGR